jgi:hypothetical protein
MFLGYITLFLVGIGPSIWFMSPQNPKRIALALCIAPVVGLAETGLIFYPLILNDQIIQHSAYPVILLLLMISISLLFWDIRHNPNHYKRIAAGKDALLVGAGFLISIGLLLLSPLMGGESSQFWQGNPWDANGYLGMARYAQIAPVSYSSLPDQFQTLTNIDPTLSAVFSNQLIFARPAASNTLAWLSTLFNIPLYSGYYFIKLLYLILIFGVTVAICIRLKMPLRWVVACAIVLTVGFWSVFVLDIDALSALSALPINLLILFAGLCLEQEAPDKLLSRQRVLFGLALAAGMVFYPESFMEIIGAIGIYYILRVVHGPFQLHRIVQLILGLASTIIITLLLQLPDLSTTLKFLYGQASFASSPLTIPWARTYFPWLYQSNNLLRDFWGLHFFQFSNTTTSSVLWLATSLLGAALVLVLCWGIVRSVIRRSLPFENKLLTAFLISFLGIAVAFLFLRQQLWLAGKALSYGFSFVTIAVFFYACRDLRSNTRGVSWLIKLTIIIWFVAEAVSPLLQSVAVVSPAQYPLYSQLIARTSVPEIDPALASIKANPPHSLGIDFEDLTNFYSTIWESALVASNPQFTVLAGNGTYFDTHLPLWWQESDLVPEQLLLSPKRNFLSRLHLGHVLVDNSPYFLLSAVTSSEIDQSVMFPPINDLDTIPAVEVNDLDKAFLLDGQNKLARWTLRRDGVPNPDQTLFRFWASGTTNFGVYLQYTPNFTGSVAIVVNNTSVMQQSLISADPQQTVFCMQKPGTNTITLNYMVNKLLNIGQDNQRLRLQEVLFAINGRVDVGAEAQQLLVGDGWYAPEQWGTTPVRWSAKESQLSLLYCDLPTKLYFRAFVADGITRTVMPTLNGIALGSVKLMSGWHDYTMPIPANAYRVNAKQTLVLDHDGAQIPANDTRLIAAAYDWVALE